MLEPAGAFEGDIAVEGAAEQPDGVRLVGLGEPVAAQDGPGHLRVPDGRAGAGRLRVEVQLRGGVAAGVLVRVVPVGVGEGGQGVLAGPARQRGGGTVGEFLQGQQGDPGLEVLGVLDVGVEARVLDAEAPRERGNGHLVEADLVGEFRPRRRQALGVQSHACHARPLAHLGQ